MIPSLIVLGLAIGFIPRPWYQLGAVLAGMGWTALLAVNGTIDTGNSFEMFHTFIFGTINVAIGATITHVAVPILRNLVRNC